MPVLYEIHLLDRKEAGLKPWKYSGSSWHNNNKYMGSSCHPQYKRHLKESSNIEKVIIQSFSKDDITKLQLRQIEAQWQKIENHKNDENYYNLTDSQIYPLITDDSKKKISETLKRLNINPYKKDLTHSSESLSKRKESMKKLSYRAFYNPETFEFKMFAIGDGEIPPSNWIPGRKPKKINIKHEKIGGQIWEIYKDDLKIWEGQNLKKYCDENNLTYLRFNPNGYNVKEIKESLFLSLSSENTVICNGTDSGLSQARFCEKYKYSKSMVSVCIKKQIPYKIWNIVTYKALKIK